MNVVMSFRGCLMAVSVESVRNPPRELSAHTVLLAFD
jgi:hypothetical protein